jgi:hypothetical protein
VQWIVEDNGVRIKHKFSRDAVFVATKSFTLRASIESRRQSAIQIEEQNIVAEDMVKMFVK